MNLSANEISPRRNNHEDTPSIPGLPTDFNVETSRNLTYKDYFPYTTFKGEDSPHCGRSYPYSKREKAPLNSLQDHKLGNYLVSFTS